MTAPAPNPKDTRPMRQNDRATYRASDEFTATYRECMARLNAVHAEVKAYDKANPDHPLFVSKDKVDHEISVRGFEDVHPDQDPPVGLSRASTRPFLIPKRGKPGNQWREVIARYDRYPSVDREVLSPHGIPSHRLVDFTIHTTGLYDFGDAGVFLSSKLPFEKPSSHLTAVPQSVFHAAKEAAQAARAAVTG